MDKMDADRRRRDALILRIAGGDRNALAALYEGLKTPVYGVALAILRQRSDAEDVMQSTFLRVWEHAAQYRPGTDAQAWVLTIARNLALAMVRTRKRTVPLAESLELPAPQDDISHMIDRLLLVGLLSRLDTAEREIIILYAACGYSHKEIACMLGRSYATVRWKFSNAIKKLSRIVEKAEDNERARIAAAAIHMLPAVHSRIKGAEVL